MFISSTVGMRSPYVFNFEMIKVYFAKIYIIRLPKIILSPNVLGIVCKVPLLNFSDADCLNLV